MVAEVHELLIRQRFSPDLLSLPYVSRVTERSHKCARASQPRDFRFSRHRV